MRGGTALKWLLVSLAASQLLLQLPRGGKEGSLDLMAPGELLVFSLNTFGAERVIGVCVLSCEWMRIVFVSTHLRVGPLVPGLTSDTSTHGSEAPASTSLRAGAPCRSGVSPKPPGGSFMTVVTLVC